MPLTDALLEAETYAGDPHGVFAGLRAAGPLAWNATKGFWAVSHHAEVLAASTDPATFCSGRGILVEEIGRTYDSPPTMMHTDPPAHTRYRGLAQPAFKPSAMRAMDTMVHELAGALVDRLPHGAPVDVVHELAEPFPLQVIGWLLGMDASDQDKLVAWSNASIPGAGDFTDDERLTLMGEMTVELLGLAGAAAEAAAGGAAGDGLIATLATVEVDGEKLTSDELGMFLIQLLVAGNETTRNALSGGLVALAERPEAWARLRAEPALVATAVEEILRWTTPVISFMRTATRDCTLGGVAVTAGDPLLLLYASANRDDAAFGPTASAFDVGRDPNHHLAFGFGTHFCLGAALARLELRVMLELLLHRFESIALAGPVERSGSSIIAGVRAAPLQLSSS